MNTPHCVGEITKEARSTIELFWSNYAIDHQQSTFPRFLNLNNQGSSEQDVDMPIFTYIIGNLATQDRISQLITLNLTIVGQSDGTPLLLKNSLFRIPLEGELLRLT